MRSISRGWPTAATACSVPMSVGRVVEPERGQPGRDRARAHQHDLVAGGARGGELAAELAQRGVVELAAVAT